MISSCLVKQGKYELAFDILEQLLDGDIEVLAKNDFDALTSMSCIGLRFMEQFKPDSAVRVFERLLTKQKEYLGESHTDTLGTMHNIGVCYMEQAR